MCSADLVKKDIVVRLRKERFLIPNFLAGKGRVCKKMAIPYCQLGDGRH